ncbi:12458_t:CDS:2, partial [Acaulospora colombiana]
PHASHRRLPQGQGWISSRTGDASDAVRTATPRRKYNFLWSDSIYLKITSVLPDSPPLTSSRSRQRCIQVDMEKTKAGRMIIASYAATLPTGRIRPYLIHPNGSAFMIRVSNQLFSKILVPSRFTDTVETGLVVPSRSV